MYIQLLFEGFLNTMSKHFYSTYIQREIMLYGLEITKYSKFMLVVFSYIARHFRCKFPKKREKKQNAVSET